MIKMGNNLMYCKRTFLFVTVDVAAYDDDE